jgi:hypothetical protein
MMKLQAPLHDTDKDPAMAAEAALTNEYNFDLQVEDIQV